MEVLHTSMWSNLVFLADGIVVSLSIEAMHRYRQSYEKELKEVKAINKELDEFTYIASHDLKEPLRGIHNYMSFLKEDHAEKLDQEAQQYIDSTQRLAERMTNLTDQLLAYSKLGKAEMKKEPVDVDAIVDEVLEDLSGLRPDGIELRRIGKLGTAKGDAIRIGEVFQNLITNAAKYNDKSSKWVEIGRDDSGVHPVFYVRDNGIGIKPQHKDRVFQIFKRLNENSKFGSGTGAGLTIVKKIIERHGGRIWLDSVPDEGTTFYFTLTGDE
jgi:light-regulated signal transduction histidine kinase (bacteriophytochrome)